VAFKPLFFLTILTAFIALQPSPATAQFGGFFGGPTIETVETDTLADMLRERRKAESEASQADQSSPKSNFVLVDVRSDAEIAVSVIPGAITKEQFEKNRAKYADRLIIPYCTVGGRSGAYAKQLAKDGLKVKNYMGSILKWIDAGLPLVTLDGNPTNRVHTYSDRYRIPATYEQVTK
jgi:rhodanese-related sulfurtransferase